MHLYNLGMCQGFPTGSVVKNSPAKAGDGDWIPGLVRSLGEGNGNLLYYFAQGNPMGRGAQTATVHGVAESDMTQRLNSNKGLCCQVANKSVFSLLLVRKCHLLKSPAQSFLTAYRNKIKTNTLQHSELGLSINWFPKSSGNLQQTQK